MSIRKRVGWIAVVALAAAGVLGGGTLAAEPRVVEPDDTRLLVLDRRVIERAEHARLVLGRPEKDPRNPLLPSDRPWENATNNYYPNVHWDAAARVWKLWYKDVLADPEAIAAMDGPSTVHDVGWYLLYATSADGLRWEKPALGLHRFAGRDDTNAVARDCPNVGVFVDPHDPDPARRYKMVHDVGLGKPRVRFSGDGLHWGPAQEVQGFSAQQGDTHNNAFFDRRSGKYLWFTKLYLGERLVSRLESDDFLHWRSSGLVLRSTLAEGRAAQTYALTVFPYAQGYLGYLMMYHVGRDRRVDCELAFSPDSIHWERVAPGTAFLPLGPPESYDGGCIYAQAGPPVAEGDRLVIYYGGSPTVHLGWKRSASLCRATIGLDRFAGYEPLDGARPAVLTTAPLRPAGGEVGLVADGPVTRETLPAADGTLRLRLVIPPGSKLYAVTGATLVDAAWCEPPLAPLALRPVARGPLVFTFDRDAEGWSGLDRLEHLPDEGSVRVSRGGNLRPILHGRPLDGDWPTLLGGAEVAISARVRAPQAGGRVGIDLFARDVAQWSYDTGQPFATDWTTVAATLRYDWTDAEARAAGWRPSIHGFSWRETVRNAGKLVIVALEPGRQASFDVDQVRIEPR